MKIRAIITGSTGMVGEGVLHECLLHPDVEKVLLLNRRASGVTHAKVTEIIHDSFDDLLPILPQLAPYNACFFCLGVSSIGMNERDYAKITYDLTMNVARTLSRINPDMVFCYVSGAGTDSSEKGNSMWARVKGRTENDLQKLPFRRSYAFRPGFIRPTPGLKHTLKFYKYVTWMFPLLQRWMPRYVCTLTDLGKAMINVTLVHYPKAILEVRDIVAAAKMR